MVTFSDLTLNVQESTIGWKYPSRKTSIFICSRSLHGKYLSGGYL